MHQLIKLGPEKSSAVTLNNLKSPCPSPFPFSEVSTQPPDRTLPWCRCCWRWASETSGSTSGYWGSTATACCTPSTSWCRWPRSGRTMLPTHSAERQKRRLQSNQMCITFTPNIKRDELDRDTHCISLDWFSILNFQMLKMLFLGWERRTEWLLLPLPLI